MKMEATLWPEVELGKLSTKITVGFVGSMSHLFTPSGVPLLRGTNVFDGELDLTRLRYISHETHRAWSKSALQPGDIVIVRVGYPGRAAVIPSSLGEANAASLVVVRPDQRLLNPSFAMQHLNSPKGQAHIQSQLVGGAQQVFNTTLAAKYQIPVPPLVEQNYIAEVLHDVDHLIVTLERLIAKKQAIKLGMMQQLLTGRTRLPGFNDAWAKVALGDVASMGSGGTPPRNIQRFYGGGIPWVSITDMTTSGKYLNSTATTLTESGLNSSAAKLYEADVVLYAMYASLGEVCLPVNRVSSSQAILGILPGRQLDREFLYYHLESIKPLVKTLGQQGTQSNLNAGMVRDFQVKLPSLPEQRAIADVLKDLDRELTGLRARTNKARAIKTGVLQQLLTGRVRVPAEVSS